MPVPDGVGMLFQLIPGLHRSSGNQLSSPTTSLTVLVRAAIASASCARQSRTQSGALDKRGSPWPVSTASGARPGRGSSRTDAPPAVSGASRSISLANSAAVVNILVVDAGTKRWSGSSATTSRPSSVATTRPKRVPGLAVARSAATCPSSVAGAAAISSRGACHLMPGTSPASEHGEARVPPQHPSAVHDRPRRRR